MPNEEASARNENKRTRLTVFCVNFTVRKTCKFAQGERKLRKCAVSLTRFLFLVFLRLCRNLQWAWIGSVPFIGKKNKKPGGFYGNNIVHDYNRSKKRSKGVLWNLSVLECGDSQNQVQRQSSAHDRSGSA